MNLPISGTEVRYAGHFKLSFHFIESVTWRLIFRNVSDECRLNLLLRGGYTKGALPCRNFLFLRNEKFPFCLLAGIWKLKCSYDLPPPSRQSQTTGLSRIHFLVLKQPIYINSLLKMDVNFILFHHSHPPSQMKFTDMSTCLTQVFWSCLWHWAIRSTPHTSRPLSSSRLLSRNIASISIRCFPCYCSGHRFWRRDPPLRCP